MKETEADTRAHRINLGQIVFYGPAHSDDGTRELFIIRILSEKSLNRLSTADPRLEQETTR